MRTMSVKQVRNKLNWAEVQILAALQASMTLMLSDLLGRMKKRIFNRQGSTDSEGKKLPEYSTSYAKMAKKTAKTWDLQRTGTLMDNITTGKTKNSQVIGIAASQAKKVGEIQMKSKNEKIFDPSENEVDQATNVMTSFFLNNLERIFK